MKPAAIVVADEMFPEGVGPYMEIEEVFYTITIHRLSLAPTWSRMFLLSLLLFSSSLKK